MPKHETQNKLVKQKLQNAFCILTAADARKKIRGRTKFKLILVELLHAQILHDSNPKQGRDSRPGLLPDVRQK